MISVRCKECNKELHSHPTKTVCCGCPNMVIVKDNVVSAVDLSRVIMLNSLKKEKKKPLLSDSDLAFQESRKNRKIRKLDFEVR